VERRAQVIRGRVDEFPMSPDLVMLNHASFGLMTTSIMRNAERERAALELDSLALIDVESLAPRLRQIAARAAQHFGLEEHAFALTENATSGAAAIMRSLPLSGDSCVAVLSTEYASITRGWQVRCEEAGARFIPITVPTPLSSTEQLIDAIEDQVRAEVTIAQVSLISSSTAIAFPVRELASWFRDRGATVVLDAAHGPGHVPLHPVEWGVAAMYGTMHKWLPTPRPIGFLWLDDELGKVVRPAVVSLTWDAPHLVERFAWPGTYDPTPRLCLEAAIHEWARWESAGDLRRCEALACYASERLARAGASATSSDAFLPPRMRAATLPRVSLEDLRVRLEVAGIRAFTGYGPSGETTLRVATHVYNEESDIERVCDVVASLAPNRT
jgi:isopenicillin-N epimerase